MIERWKWRADVELLVMRGSDWRLGLAFDRHGREDTWMLSVPGWSLVLLVVHR